MARKEIMNHLIENILIDQYLNAIKVDGGGEGGRRLINELKEELTRRRRTTSRNSKR